MAIYTGIDLLLLEFHRHLHICLTKKLRGKTCHARQVTLACMFTTCQPKSTMQLSSYIVTTVQGPKESEGVGQLGIGMLLRPPGKEQQEGSSVQPVHAMCISQFLSGQQGADAPARTSGKPINKY
eukprot:1157850-Pelagomonas_calceolata.AAC.23